MSMDMDMISQRDAALKMQREYSALIESMARGQIPERLPEDKYFRRMLCMTLKRLNDEARKGSALSAAIQEFARAFKNA